MTFDEVLGQVVELLQQEKRVSYRGLKRRFALDDAYLEDLKEELLFSHPEIAEAEGRGLVWRGDAESFSSPTSVFPTSAFLQPQSPVSYTPPHLAERILAEQAAMESRGSADGERKTITALFADLKGSTALIEGLDPEDARALIDPALQLMMDAVHRYDGYVAQALGDGIFALFGAPIAHEDHPQRALYAALRMQEEMGRYGDTLRGQGRPPLHLRVGLNTGEVVVRSIRKDDLHTDYVPVGHSTNIAARMEQLATPGAILVTEQTYRLTDGYFAFKSLGKTRIKGVNELLNVYEVLGAGPFRTKLQVATRRGLTRFVGRHSEMDQLQRALKQVTAGHGQIVGVMGDPGLGKSRLFYEFKLTSQNGCLVLEAFSVSHGKASPYLPLIELLKQYFQIDPQDTDGGRRQKVIGHVLELDRSLEAILPYLFSLLSIDDPDSPLPQMDAQVRRQRTFDALKRLLLRESLNQPLILVFEDLHWIDTETQGFLDTLSEGVASAKVLLLVNYRPEYRHEWGGKTYYTQLRLAPLDKEEAEELLTFLLGADARLTALKQLILEKTEGTPFFMEEVVQTLVEEGVLAGDRGQYRLESTSTALHIPPTIQGVLAARIDRLAAEEKVLLQQLAVIGREFPLNLVGKVVSYSEDQLYRLLTALQRKEFLYEQPAFPDVEYLFKHALTQEVAYNSVLQERRKALHERTAQAIEALFQSRLEDHYSELAHHYSRSGNTEKAVEYLGLAGQQAVQRSANAEAITHLTTALELLKTLPDTSERVQQELMLQTTLGPALMATKGYAASEVEKTYIRARDLCQHVGETPQLWPVLFGLWVFHRVRGQHQTARELAEHHLHLAKTLHDPAPRLEAHLALADSFLCLGEFVSARAHAEQGIGLYDPQHHRALAFRYGQDARAHGLVKAAHTLWYLGYGDQARMRMEEALALAHELSHPNTSAMVLDHVAYLHQFRREGRATQERAEALIALCHEHGFPHWLPQGTLLRGWALAEQGQGEEGIRQIRQGLAACRAGGLEGELGYFLAMLADACWKAGQGEEGLNIVAEALAAVERTGGRMHEAELYRLKGELTLPEESQKTKGKSQQSKIETSPSHLAPSTQAEAEWEAEECFRKAIDIARQQQAKSLELRAGYHFSWGVTKNGLQERTEKAERCLANRPPGLGAARAPTPPPVCAASA